MANLPPLTPGLPRESAGFRLRRELGRGGMGIVYEAEEVSSGRRLALKVLLADLAVSKEAYERFQREARLAAAISDTHCVFVYGAHQVEGSPAIAMEIVDGETLEHKIQRGDVVPIQTAVRWTIDLIDGLEAAHSAGILHRDVKPSNCFVTEEGEVKVGDFGLSRTLERDAQLTRTGQFLGSPLYASPEQVRGRPLDFKTDMYSCGATLYATLTGRAPYSGSNVGEVLARILTEPPEPLRSVRPEIPRALERVVLRAMEREPEKRFRDMAALREALAPFATTTTTVAAVWRRIVAYLLDSSLLGLLGMCLILLQGALGVQWLAIARQPGDAGSLATDIFFQTLGFMYFLVGEGVYGTTVGKWLLGLRVVARSSREPSFTGALKRGLVFQVPSLAVRVALLTLSTSVVAMSLFGTLGPLLVFAAIFVTARRSNGWRGLHDLLSDTFVMPVALPFRVTRPATTPPEVELGARGDFPERIGDYTIEGTVGSSAQGCVLKARDATLERFVWLHIPAAGRGLADEKRRSLSRPARLRWLGTVSTPQGAGDVFEAPGGTSLARFAALHPQLEWWRSRQLMANLVNELRTEASSSGQYALEQVWIDRNWGLRLLDHPLADTAIENHTPQSLVHEAGRALFQGLGEDRVELPRDLPAHAELGVTRLLENQSSNTDLQSIAQDLENMRGGATHVLRRSRVAQLAVGTLLPAMSTLFTIVILFWIGPVITDVITVKSALRGLRADRHARAEKSIEGLLNDEEQGALEVLLSKNTEAGGVLPFGVQLTPGDTEIIAAAQQRFPAPDAEAVAEARRVLEREGTHRRFDGGENPLEKPSEVASTFAFSACAGWGALALLSILISRVGFSLAMFGIRLRDRRGRRASRWYGLARCLMAWLPLLGAMYGVMWLIHSGYAVTGMVAGGAVLALWLTAVAHAMLNPTQSIVDRVLGTRIVPR